MSTKTSELYSLKYTEAKLDETIAEMEQVIADPETYEIWFTAKQVWGTKPPI